MRKYLLFIIFLLCVPCLSQEWTIPDSSTQLVVVCNSNWDDATGVMARFERPSSKSPWKRVGKSVPINLGRTGLAWGSSPLMKVKPKGNQKKEGDGRSPAGLFPILRAFGHPSPPSGYSEKNLDFLSITDEQCVDDSSNAYYNQVVQPDRVGGVSWDSAEKMKIDLYRLGLVVGHNCPKAVPGLGSCIFFHLQKAPGSPTAGCTSMAEEPLKELLLWLKKDANPVLIQLPIKNYQALDASHPAFNR